MDIQELAQRLGAKVEGGADVEITGVATIEDAEPGQATFLANPRYEAQLPGCRASAVFVAPDFEGASGPIPIRHPNPYLAFARAIDLFYTAPPAPPGVHETAIVGRDVVLGDGVSIGPYAVIGDGVRIGADSSVHAHVVIYAGAEIGTRAVLHSHCVVREHVRLGDGVILQNGSVIGADGFGFAPTGDGSYEKITQSGTVTIEDDVEFQANACIDRATVGATTVGRGTKVDNLTQIGHGCHVGENALLCGQVGLAGSTNVGDRVVLAGQVGIAGHCTIGDDTVVAAQGGVANDLEPATIYGGTPVMNMKLWRQCIVLYKKLPQTAKRMKELERKVAALEEGRRDTISS